MEEKESPQVEDGHTDIANEIMDALSKTRIPGEARQILDFIIRKTYGWHKKRDRISLSQFVSGTNLKKTTVCRGINKLKEMNLIVTQKDNDLGIYYCFNKHYRAWKSLPKKITNAGRVLKGRKNVAEIKNVTRERDNNICLHCKYDGTLAKETLHVHHIDFNQGNNNENNLITLCRSCHGKAHNNNIQYKQFLINLITQKDNRDYPKRQSGLSKKSTTKETNTKETNTKETNTKDKRYVLISLFKEIESKFTEDELNHKTDFLEYWREKKPGGKKERWEMQKVFDINLRFRTWLRNNYSSTWDTPKKKDTMLTHDED